MRYVVRDQHDQKIYLTGENTATALCEVQHHLRNADSAKPNKETFALAFQFTEQIRRLGRAERSQFKPINPLFLRWEALDLGRFDGPLRRFAMSAMPVILVMIGLTFFACLALGAGSSWTIFEQSRSNISFSGLALFAVLSPFLKIPHELGHVLVARYFNVRLRGCGLIFVGLLPLPFVDCSMADVDANRGQRILISLAGVFTDIWLAMAAFIGWHLVDGEFARTLMMNVLVFSSLNSVLFNGNPLIRLDGYYAFADLIGHRNLSSKSALIYKGFRSWIVSFGRLGARPIDRTGWAYLAFGTVSGIYKVYVLLLVVWVVLPKLLGLGGLVVAWGALVMFATPLMKEKTSNAPAQQARGPRAIFWMLFLCVGMALCIIPIPLKTAGQLAIDTEDSYTVRLSEAGRLTAQENDGVFAQGDVLITLHNLELEDNLALTDLQIKTQTLAFESAAGTDPTQALAASEQLDTLRKDLEQLQTRWTSLDVLAPSDGSFYASQSLTKGGYLAEGARLGYFLPHTDSAKFIFQMDERFVSNFKAAAPELSLWERDSDNKVPAVIGIALKLFQTTNVETGRRNFQVVVTLAINPNEVQSRDIWGQLNFGTLPLWQHANRWLLRMQQTYFEVRFGQLK